VGIRGTTGQGQVAVHARIGAGFHAEISAGIGTTDFQRELRGLWIAELSELDSLRGKEATTIKRLLLAPVDRFVQKYALNADTYPRRAICVATTNEVAYWQDPTGARRLIPIRCGDIRVDLIEDNRLQWFAEALHLYRTGSTWWVFPVAIADEQEARQQGDAWEDTLREYMTHGRHAGFDGQVLVPWPSGWISSATILREWLRLEPSQQSNVCSTRLGKVMRKLGYVPKRSASGTNAGGFLTHRSQRKPRCQTGCQTSLPYHTDTSDTYKHTLQMTRTRAEKFSEIVVRRCRCQTSSRAGRTPATTTGVRR